MLNKIKLFLKKIKPFLIIAAIAVVLAVFAVVFSRLSCREDQVGRALQLGDVVPPGWVAPPVETTTPWPHTKKNRADEVLKPFPPGSRVVEVDGKQVCAIMPGGEVVVPEGVNAVVYVKPPRSVAFEARPWVAFGASGSLTAIKPSGAAGLDVLRIKRAHIGLGACVDSGAVSALLVASYNPWRNLDVIAGGGYGTSGACAFAGVGLGIQ